MIDNILIKNKDKDNKRIETTEDIKAIMEKKEKEISSINEKLKIKEENNIKNINELNKEKERLKNELENEKNKNTNLLNEIGGNENKIIETLKNQY